MNEIRVSGVPSTFGAVGIVATHLLLGTAHSYASNPPNRIAPYIDYTLSSSTYGEHADLFSASGLTTAAMAASSIDAFFAELLVKQERLGKELEEALFENLWDLYAR
jgi:hypothetical protein